MSKDNDKLVVMGVIASAHGIRGEVKIKSFTETPEDIAAYGPLLLDEGPETVEIERLRPCKGGFIARLRGVEDRNAAELLKGRKLTLPRERLPEIEEEDTFYHSDLIGLKAEKEGGQPAGQVVAVHDFGAGDLLEIRAEGTRETYYLPFTKEAVPHVDVKGGKVIINPPAELEEDALKKGARGTHGKHKQRRHRKDAARREQARRGAKAAKEADSSESPSEPSPEPDES